MDLAPWILFEDVHVIAINKPAGLRAEGVQPNDPSLEMLVRSHFSPGDPSSAYVGIVHRIDRPVSGILIWAKTSKAARRLSQQFERRRVRKRYWAVVEGQPAPPEGVWNDWLYEEWTGINRVQVCHADTPRARQAVTRYAASSELSAPEGCSCVELWPETGRRHQLRVQAGERGLPILGDTLYGSTRPFPQGIALHARTLSVIHPATNEPLDLIAPVPEAWAGAGIEVRPSPE